MSKKSFILHIDSLVILDDMPDDIAGKFIKILYQYNNTGELPEMDFALKMAVTPFINQFKRDAQNYNKVVEKRREAGAKGGKQKVANATKSEQSVAKLADSVSVNDSVSDNKNENVSSLMKIADEFMSEKYLAERQLFEMSTKVKITPELVSQFNANVISQSKVHSTVDEYKRHFISWIPKRPKLEIQQTSSFEQKRLDAIEQQKKFLAENPEHTSW